MCGFVVVLDPTGTISSNEIELSLNQIQHRGPDDRKIVKYDLGAFNVNFGFQRLSITDPQPRSMQPIVSRDGFTTLVFNGEIYNFLALRTELSRLGHFFETSGDAEVLLAAYQEWGVKFVNNLDGMFSIVILDRLNNYLLIARDIYGEKPLFYSQLRTGELIFASEAKAIISYKCYDFKYNEKLIKNTALGYVNFDHDETIFEDIFNFPKGHFGIYAFDTKKLVVSQFYSFKYHNDEKQLDDRASMAKLYYLLSNSVKMTNAADVQGILSLSGGLDSSILASLRARQFTGKATDAISVGMSKYKEIDESAYVNLVTKHLNINCEIMDFGYSTDDFAQRCISELRKMHFHHENVIPGVSMFLEWELYRRVSEMGIKVVYDGQGADEIFAGYSTYFKSLQLDYLPSNFLNKLDISVQRYLRQKRIKKLSKIYQGENTRFSVDDLIPKHDIKMQREVFWSKFQKYFDKVDQELLGDHLSQDLKLNLEKTSLPPNVVCGDRSAMAFGIEVRHPFLTRDIVEFGLSLKNKHYFSRGYGKFLLRKTFEGLLPSAVIWRADKVGYAGPEMSIMKSNVMKASFDDSLRASQLDQLIEVKDKGLIKNDWLCFSASEILNLKRRDWVN